MAHEAIEWALDTLQARAERYGLYRAYYDGDHRLAFATDKFRSAFGLLFSAFSDNLCPVVVDTPADRLTIEAISATEPAGEDAAKQAQDIWTKNRMVRRSGEVHSEALRSGDAYALVWPNARGQVRIWPHTGRSMAVQYDEGDEPDRIVRAGKRWVQADKRHRLTLYFEDHFERYVSREVPQQGAAVKADAYVPYTGDDDGPEVANEYGQVPVFHFGNNAPLGEYGRSELKDIIPIQDALNKSLADMLVAMEFVALPQRWVTGLQVETNMDGTPAKPPFDVGPDRIWTLRDHEARFGQFAQADLTQFLQVQESLRVEMARISGLPVYYFLPAHGSPPSGESQKTSEGRTTKKARDRQEQFGITWQEALSFSVRLALGDIGERQDPMPIEVIWENPETRDELAEATTQEAKQRVGVSKQQSLRELGYTDEEIERMEEEKRTNAEEFGMAALAAFDAGSARSGFAGRTQEQQ